MAQGLSARHWRVVLVISPWAVVLAAPLLDARLFAFLHRHRQPRARGGGANGLHPIPRHHGRRKWFVRFRARKAATSACMASSVSGSANV